jgi:hypothetical protein
MLTKEASVKTKNRTKREGNKRSQKWLTNETIIKTKKFIKSQIKRFQKMGSKRNRHQNEKSIKKGGKQTKPKNMCQKKQVSKRKSIKKWKKAKQLIE